MIEREERPRRSFNFDAEPVEDDALTWQARGLLLYLLSKPNHWRTDRGHLATQAPNGLSSVRSILAELELAGYLTRERVRGEGGQWAWKHVVHERPVPSEQRTSGGKSTNGVSSKDAGQTTGRFTAGGQPAAIGSNGRPRVTDTPTAAAPDGEPAKNGQTDNAGRIVADWIKAQAARPDDKTVGMVAQAVGKALKRHVPPEAVRAGLAHMATRGLDASMATRCIDAAAAKQSPDLQRASRAAHLSALKAETPNDERVPFGARFTPEQADALLGGAG